MRRMKDSQRKAMFARMNTWKQHSIVSYSNNPKEVRLQIYSQGKTKILQKTSPESSTIEIWKTKGKEQVVPIKTLPHTWEGSSKAHKEVRKLMGKDYKIIDDEHPARKLNRKAGVDVKMIEKHDPNYYKPDIKAAEKKKFIQDHERMLLMSKAKAYSNLSLQRPLTDSELKEYKKVMSELQK